MELISKISRGSKMDQVYLPKNRIDFNIGSYVVIKPLRTKKLLEKPYFYGIKDIEPVKLSLVNDVFNSVNELIGDCDNVIITGSFLDKGFNFNDIDILIVSGKKLSEKFIGKTIGNKLRIKIHVLLISSKVLIRGLKTDPLYQMMLSRCVAKKRFIYKTGYKINYKILDLHLLKSNQVIYGFDYLTGNEKYYLTRNMTAIHLFLNHRKVNSEIVNREIKKLFNLKDINVIRQNMIEDKKGFLRKFKAVYNETFDKIVNSVKDGAKQK